MILEGIVWINVVQLRDQWRALLKKAMNHRVS